MAGRYNKPVRYGRESAHKSGAAKANTADCMRGNQHFLGDVRDRQQDLGEVSCCGLC